MNVVEIEDKYGIPFYDRQNLVVEKGKGSHVWDDKGGRYLDFTSGWGVTCLGHAHPVITNALCEQSKKLMQNPNSGFTYSPARALLLERLQQVLPVNLSRTFFTNSGAEANDAAIKLARKLSGKARVISTRGSFHGRTFNTLSVSGGEQNTRRYIPQLPQTQFVEFGDIREIEAAINDNTAAVIVEPVQGEGGVRIPPAGYLGKVAQLCKENTVLLIVDEIQTGFCRTGRFFGLSHSDSPVEADIVTMGKGIAGGFPFAAFSVTDEVARKIEKGDHGGTYCGNPLGCAVASEVIRFLQENCIALRVLESGRKLLKGLQMLADEYPELVSDARGIGLLTALQMKEDGLVGQLSTACQQRGLLVTPTRNGVVRFIPDLLVETGDIELALEMLGDALSSIECPLAAASQAGIACG